MSVLWHRPFPSLDFLQGKVNRPKPPPLLKKKRKKKERLDFPLRNEANINDSYREEGRDLTRVQFLREKFYALECLCYNSPIWFRIWQVIWIRRFYNKGSIPYNIFYGHIIFSNILFCIHTYFYLSFPRQWDIGVEIQNAEVLCPRIPLLNNENHNRKK